VNVIFWNLFTWVVVDKGSLNGLLLLMQHMGYRGNVRMSLNDLCYTARAVTGQY